MTNKKYLWIVVPLSIALAGSVVVNFMAWRYFKAMEIWSAGTEIQNAKFRAEKLTKLRHHLSNGEIEEAQALAKRLYGIEISLFEIMQEPDLYPESVQRRAKSVLTQFESDFNSASKNNEESLESSN